MLRFAIDTDIARLVVCDPATLSAPIPSGPYRAQCDRLDAECRAGNVLVFETGGDGAFLIDAYVGEEAPAVPDGMKSKRCGPFRLRLPHGTIVGSGLEAVLDGKKAPAATGVEHALPAGDYRVEVLLLDWEDPDEQFRKRVGDDDAEWYAATPDPTVWGCVTLLALLVFSFGSRFEWGSPASIAGVVAAVALLITVLSVIRRRSVTTSERYIRLDGIYREIEESLVDAQLIMQRSDVPLTDLEGGSVAFC